MLVIVDEILDFVSKADQDGAAAELVRIGLYEALADECDRIRPRFAQDLERHVAKVNTDARRALVREYIAKRAEGEDVEDVLQAAAYLTAVDVVFSKDTEDDKSTPFYDARDARGRFASFRRALGVKGPKDGGEAWHNRNDRLNTIGTFADAQGRNGLKFAEGDRYQRSRLLGDALRTSDSAGANALGLAAQVAGNLGPEAQAVLGPGLRRTAYRYRGTEKPAAPEVKRDVKEANAFAAELAEGGSASLAQAASSTRPGGQARELPPAVGAASYLMSTPEGRHMTPDQQALAIRGDTAAAYLRKKLATPEQTRISIAAGRVPPSQGVLIDADGDVVSEAMGFNGDHYLPFDLKNLKELQGGQYVRTRAKGGPTTEDIYTGLITGTRQMQVVSHSGVFSVEFDPSLRGGKRYGDKARQMVSRYGKLLDAIDQGGLYSQDLPPEQMQSLNREAMQEAGYNRERAKGLLKEKVDRARAEASLDTLSDEDVTTAARNQLQSLIRNKDPKVGNQSAQGLARLQGELEDGIREKNRAQEVKAYRLDGEGYKAALKSLQEEFPYFIRSVRHEQLPKFLENRRLYGPDEPRPSSGGGGSDRGYVAPGNTRARSVEDGRRYKEFYAADARHSLGRDPKPGAKAADAPAGTDSRDTKTATKPNGEPAAQPAAVMASNSQVINQGASHLDNIFFLANRLAAPGKAVPGMDENAIAGHRDSIDVLAWLEQRQENTPQEAVKYLMTAAPEPVVERVEAALHELAYRGSIRDDGMFPGVSKPEVQKEAREAADALRTLLAVRKPFGKEATAENVRKPVDTKNPKPLAFSDMTGLNTRQKLKSYIETHPEVRAETANYGRRGAEGAKNDAQILNDIESTSLKADELESAIGGAQGDRVYLPNGTQMSLTEADFQRTDLVKALEAKHRAFAFRQADHVLSYVEKTAGGQVGPPFGLEPQAAPTPAGPKAVASPFGPSAPHNPAPASAARSPRFRQPPGPTGVQKQDLDAMVDEVAKAMGHRLYGSPRRRLSR